MITGDEDDPLDLEGLVDMLPGLAGEVDSYAVCGAMSIKIPPTNWSPVRRLL